MQHGYVRENVQYVRIRVRTYVVHIHTFACCSTPKQTSNYVKIDAHAHGNRRPDERTHGRTDGQTDRQTGERGTEGGQRRGNRQIHRPNSLSINPNKQGMHVCWYVEHHCSAKYQYDGAQCGIHLTYHASSTYLRCQSFLLFFT